MTRCMYVCSTALLFLALLSGRVEAVPAFPYKVTVPTVNGDSVEIFLRGDEYNKYAVTSDGYTLLSNEQGWWYATCADNGQIVPSQFRLMSSNDENDELKNFKAVCPKGLVPIAADTIAARRAQAARITKSSNRLVTGQRHALVILMQYRDLPFSKSQQEFERLFNASNYHDNGATGSVRDFYNWASQGQLDYISDVYGPYTSRYQMNYYGSNSSWGGNDAHAVDLCIEAMKSLPNTVDFSHYDNDNDGVIDNVHIIFAGYGEEAGGPSNAIWSHEYPYRISLSNEIGYSLAGYSCSPELRGNWGTNISHIGVVCHELGHALGAMDYYDTNYDTNGSYDGTGQWDIMASGSWNDNGRTPPCFNPYVRTEVFGWNTQTPLVTGKYITIPQRLTDNPEQSTVYRMDTGSNGDYFLLENRQKMGFDSALPGQGLMIYHVHPNISRYRTSNAINASHPQTFYPVCASGSEPSQKNYGNINSAGCPFPGSSGIRSFTSTTSPAAIAWNGSAATIGLANITITQGAVSFTTTEGTTLPPDDPEPEPPVTTKLVFAESFESGLSEGTTVNSILGNNIWRIYKKGNLVADPDYIPEPTHEERLLMLYSGKDNTVCESEMVSQKIRVAPGITYVFTFDVYSTIAVSSPMKPHFTLFTEDCIGDHALFTLDNATDAWKHIEQPVVFADTAFCYKLNARIFSGGIFIDNIRLYAEESITPVSLPVNGRPSHPQVFTITGMRTGSMSSGINIIRTNDGITRKVILPKTNKR